MDYVIGFINGAADDLNVDDAALDEGDFVADFGEIFFFAAGKVVEPAPMCGRAVVERAAAEPCCLLKALAATVNKEKREPART